MQVSAPYSTLLNNLCTGGTDTACTTTLDGLSDACVTALTNFNTSVCSGTCATQGNAVIAACGNRSTVSLIVYFT